jgi:hypothetical protein
MKTFCLLPTETGDWLAINGDDPCPVGDEKAGVAERELLSDTANYKQNRINYHRKSEITRSRTQAFPIKFGAMSIQNIKIHLNYVVKLLRMTKLSPE